MINANAGLFESIKPVPPSSYPGAVDAAVVMSTLARKAGYAFENNGVSVMLSTPYLQGSLWDQMARCADAANINWTIDLGTLAIWPKGGSRAGSMPVISSKTGMVGYPTNWGYGIGVRTSFSSQLQIGKSCEVQSILPFANGKFTMFDIEHDLESETPNGSWFTQFHGSRFNVAT
jgi:hypothetical protein